MHNLEIMVSHSEVGNCHFHCINVSDYKQIRFLLKSIEMVLKFILLSLISKQLENI